MQGNRQIRQLARTIAFAAAGATLLAGVTVAANPTEASGGLPAGTLGQYVGFDEGGRFARAESDLGRRLDWVVTMADPGSPSAMRSSVWGQFSKSSAYLPGLSDRLDVTVSIPLAFGKAGLLRTVGPEAVRQALAKTSSGAYDADYRVVARQLIDAGYGDAVLRLGHEFDGTWQPWSSRGGNEDAYIAAFRHVRNIFERESQAFRYEWTGMHGPWRWHAPKAYPGDAYVDIIGLDVYYRAQGTIDDTRWQREFEAALVAHRDFAIARGKPVSFPEWGRARDDTSRFIGLMYDWFDSLPNSGPGRLAYQAYFNPPGQGGEYDINNYPVVKKRYLELFRTTSPVSLPASPATPTTATPTTAAPTPTTTLKPAERLATTTTVASLPSSPTNTAAAPTSPTSDNREIWSQKLPTVHGTLIDGTLSLSWYHPDAERYLAKYRAVGTRWWKWTTQGADTSLTATGLREGTAYQVQVRMHDVPNWYPWHEVIIEPSSSGDPVAPLSVTPATPSTTVTPAVPSTSPTSDDREIWSQKLPTVHGTLVDGTLLLSWYHPDAERYIARYRAVGTRWWTWTSQGPDTSFTATGLRKDTAYQVQVKMHDVPSWYPWHEVIIHPSDTARLVAPPSANPTSTTESVTTETVVTEAAVPGSRPRVLIDTDLGGDGRSESGSISDPDDYQSLVRAVHYSDALDIEGIVSTYGPGIANPELIREWIRRADVDHLREQGYTDLMSEAELLAAVKSGTRELGAPEDGRSTEGSRHMIARAHAGSASDPLWILTWGSLGTVAQALHDDPSIVPKIRLYSIGDYNIRANREARDSVRGVLDDHPDLWWVENATLPFQSGSTYRGIFEGGVQSGEWNAVTFVERHIRGHGTTAGGEFSERLGDAFPGATGPAAVRGGLKEGDSPSLLYLLSPRFSDVGDLDDPTQPSWGGRFRNAGPDTPNYYVDIDCPTTEQCQETINRHRVDFLSHWRDRWDRYEEPND